MSLESQKERGEKGGVEKILKEIMNESFFNLPQEAQ